MTICPLDPLLKKYKVFIDDFQKEDGYHFLSHAHQDHMKGLTRTFPYSIYCTLITSQLLNITNVTFVLLELNQKLKLQNNLYVTALEANHCDGSIMLFFEVENQRMLYTCDFRFLHNSNYKNIKNIDKLYFDDTFYHMKHLPSYADSFKDLLSTIFEIRKNDNFKNNSKIYINANILGIESILRLLSDTLHEGFQFSKSMKNTPREKQLHYLLGNRIVSTSNLVLANRAKDNLTKYKWIFLTATHFLCPKGFKLIPSNHFYIWFSCHANEKEVLQLANLTSAKYLISCHYQLDNLKCNK